MSRVFLSAVGFKFLYKMTKRKLVFKIGTIQRKLIQLKNFIDFHDFKNVVFFEKSL